MSASSRLVKPQGMIFAATRRRLQGMSMASCHTRFPKLTASCPISGWAATRRMSSTATILATQNSTMSNALLELYRSDPKFVALADRLQSEINRRNEEDGEKLAKGVQLAVDKGVLPANVTVEPTFQVMVSGKTADQVADTIIEKLGDASSKGCVLVLQGLSGTGKGTTVAKLQEKLPNAVTWSNGNVFRSFTLLALKYMEHHNCPFEDALKPETLASFCGMLEFDQFNGKFDVKIEGLGIKYFVSDVEKSVLKDSKIAAKIPTMAEVTQGEVINFVQAAFNKMSASGVNVLVEGREQTLNHVRTPHRFELVLDDPEIIGKRQAALQMGARAWAIIGKSASASEDAVRTALDQALTDLS